MGLLTSINQATEIETAGTSATTHKVIENETTDQPPTEQPSSGNQSQIVACENDCPLCGEGEWWIDIYGGGPHCEICKPPMARGLIDNRYFFAEDGSKWIARHLKSGEQWTKVA